MLEGDKNWNGVGHNAVASFADGDFLVFHGYDANDKGRSKLRIETIDVAQQLDPEGPVDRARRLDGYPGSISKSILQKLELLPLGAFLSWGVVDHMLDKDLVNKSGFTQGLEKLFVFFPLARQRSRRSSFCQHRSYPPVRWSFCTPAKMDG